MVVYADLVQRKYLDFFADENSTYLYEDEVHVPRYIGIAYEFLCELSSGDLAVDYGEIFTHQFFHDEKWLFVDVLATLSDKLLASLTARQIVTILVAIRHKEMFCMGFLADCGKAGVISRFLYALEEKLKKG